MQKTGWILGIMIEHSRSIQAMALGGPVGPTLDLWVLRGVIMDNQSIMLGYGRAEPTDNLQADECVYWISEKLGGTLTTPILRFIAPSGQKIRQIKAERVEQNKKAKAARMERSEIGREIRRPTKEATHPNVAVRPRRNRL